MYQIRRRNSFDKDVKGYKNNKPLKEEIKKAAEAVIENPQIGDPLHDNWKHFKSYHFSRAPEMRLIYVILPCCKETEEKCEPREQGLNTDGCGGLVDFVFAKTREECNNLYAKNKKYTESLLGQSGY
jgi:mRNA-degrading endonuclease YafQ of YafQ-DinJ toxin-antitoxin module